MKHRIFQKLKCVKQDNIRHIISCTIYLSRYQVSVKMFHYFTRLFYYENLFCIIVRNQMDVFICTVGDIRPKDSLPTIQRMALAILKDLQFYCIKFILHYHVIYNTLSHKRVKIIFLYNFTLKTIARNQINILEDICPFCGVTDTLNLDFW